MKATKLILATSVLVVTSVFLYLELISEDVWQNVTIMVVIAYMGGNIGATWAHRVSS